MREFMIGEEITPQVQYRVQPGTRLFSWLNLERLLYGVALVIGVWLRFWALGERALSPWEASNSWPAWLAANGLSVADSPSPTSSLFYGLQWLLFWVGVNGDAGARFVGAVAGSVLVVLPWWWREFLGRRTALILAFLIAIDAWLIGFSRLADGAMLSLLLGMLALTAMSRVVQLPQSMGWKQIVAVSIGLLIVSGPMGWNFMPVVLWWGWLLYGGLATAGLWQRQWLLWLVGAGILGATFLFARVDGMAWLASGMSVWISQLDGRNAGPLLPVITGGYDMGWPWLRLWVDAAPLLPLGIGGFVVLIWRTRISASAQTSERLLLLLCSGWLLWGMLLAVLPGRSPLALPMLGLPLLILTAYVLNALLASTPQGIDWREAGAVIVTLTILIISGGFWLTALLATTRFDPVLAQATLVIFGLALAILLAFGFWANRRDAIWIGAAIFSVLLLIVSFRSSWKLSFGSPTLEPAGWEATMAHPELRLFVRDVEILSSHRAGDPYELPVQVQVAPIVMADEQVVPARPDPVVGWTLRNMRNLRWVTSPSVNVLETDDQALLLPLVVTPVSAADEEVPMELRGNYAGSRYTVDTWWLPEQLDSANPTAVSEGPWGQIWAANVQPWWRWFVYRKAVVAPQPREIVLWAPLEIASPSP